jgi:hypothetical protein
LPAPAMATETVMSVESRMSVEKREECKAEEAAASWRVYTALADVSKPRTDLRGGLSEQEGSAILRRGRHGRVMR